MNDRAFYSMCALTLLASVSAIFGHWQSAVAPVLMFFLIGFQALASAMSAGTAATTKIGAGLQPASAVGATSAETPNPSPSPSAGR